MTTVIDLTTPSGLSEEMKRLKNLVIGEMPYVHVSISDASASLTIYHNICGSNLADNGIICAAKGKTFREMIEAAEREIKAYLPRIQEQKIRKMALAIIEVTDEHTHCTVRLLEAKGFARADIREYHTRACDRASEMCGNTPFKVEGLK